jgi:methionine-gamma-lyase
MLLTPTRESQKLHRVMDPSLSYSAALDKRFAKLATLAVHAGDGKDEGTRATDRPIVLSSAFEFESAEDARGAFEGENDSLIYGRWRNPTVADLERKVAALEGGQACCATASGMAAIFGAIAANLDGGTHVVAPRSMYAESARLLRERLPRFGIHTTFVDGTDVDAYARAIEPSTKLLYVETPSNPTLGITDVEGVVALAKARGLLTLCDNTFATPFCQTPLELGADLVVHSMTKALGGHGDAIGGAVVGDCAIVERVRDFVVKGVGGTLAPLNAYLVTRGLRTFPLRQRQACGTAALLAQRLASHPAVEAVFHPSLPSHPGHERATRQMFAYGSLLSFTVRAKNGTSSLDRGRRVLESVSVLTHAVSLGDVKSLLVHPASTTHSTMPPPDREKAGIADGLLRMSVGIEGADDLWADLETALAT